jgi:hypothetical protein
VAYTYHPRDPHGKLREVGAKWMAAMRVAGRQPNRTVVFGHDPAAADTAQVRGFLIEDRRSANACGRYLVLEDGDVLCAPSGGWLPEPDDDVVTLLSRALADARMGGSGWLAEGDGTVELAPDRRSERLPHQGPERRGAD